MTVPIEAGDHPLTDTLAYREQCVAILFVNHGEGIGVALLIDADILFR